MTHRLGSFRAGTVAAMIGAVMVGGRAIFVTLATWLWLYPAPATGGLAQPFR
jgi:hypothetical protein